MAAGREYCSRGRSRDRWPSQGKGEAESPGIASAEAFVMERNRVIAGESGSRCCFGGGVGGESTNTQARGLGLEHGLLLHCAGGA